MLYTCVVSTCVTRLTKQALLAHTVARFLEKQYGFSFFGLPCMSMP